MTRAHRIILPALLLLLVLLFPAVSLAGQYEVYRVVDGDTFVVKHGSVKLTIRMVGIDAPEASTSKHRAGQPFSRQSTQHLSSLVLNKTVDVKSYGSDRNGRTLGEVFLLNGKNINWRWFKSVLQRSTVGNLHQVWTWDHTGRQRRKPRLRSGACGCWGTST